MNVSELVEQIESKEDFIKFLHALNKDFLSNGQSWENPDLGRYLEAMEAFLSSSTEKSLYKMDFTPSWKLFAEILLTASIYE